MASQRRPWGKAPKKHAKTGFRWGKSLIPWPKNRPPDGMVGVMTESQERRLDSLKQGQMAIYGRIDPENRAILDAVLEYIRQGRLEMGKMVHILDAIRRAQIHIQQTSFSDYDEIRQYLNAIQQDISSNLGVQGQLELSLPIIPGLLNFRVTADAGAELSAI
jgi:hypothetical protein